MQGKTTKKHDKNGQIAFFKIFELFILIIWAKDVPLKYLSPTYITFVYHQMYTLVLAKKKLITLLYIICMYSVCVHSLLKIEAPSQHLLFNKNVHVRFTGRTVYFHSHLFISSIYYTPS